MTLPATFNNNREAIRARNTVRDTLNREHAAAVIRTRLVEEDGKTTVFFTMLPPGEGD